MNNFRWDKAAYPYLSTDTIVIFAVNHNLKGEHIVFLDRVARVEKTDGRWQAIPLTFKQYRKTYHAPDGAIMVYAGTEKAQFVVVVKLPTSPYLHHFSGWNTFDDDYDNRSADNDNDGINAT